MGETCSLDEMADLQVGFAFKSSEYSTDPSHARLLRGDNIAQGRLRWDRCAHWEGGDIDTRYHLYPGDVVLAMDRPWVGAGLKFASVRKEDTPSYLVQRVARLRAKPGTHQRYLHYLIASAQFSNYVLSAQTGTAVPHISGTQILEFRAQRRKYCEQRAISEVLGALDDKIAANDRRSQLLLDLAEAKFRKASDGFPVLESTFDKVADISGGGTPKSSIEEYWNGSIEWATPTDITALSAPYLFATSRNITEAGLAACSSRLYPPGSILMTSRATIGAFAIAQSPIAVNQGFIVVNAKKKIHQYWLFHEMRSRVSEFTNHANGATFLELSRGKFKKFNVQIPGDAKASSFQEEVGAIHKLAAQISSESTRLARTRDELLPQLVSGKVRVRDAERTVEEVV